MKRLLPSTIQPGAVAEGSGYPETVAWPALLPCGVGVSLYGFMALLRAPGADLPRHVAWFLFSFSCYLVGVALVLRAEGRGRLGRSLLPDLALILGVGLLLRALLLATYPSLSDDVFRYVWDGKVSNAGLDPYRYSPSAPELIPLRDHLWEGINHKSMVTPYPPAAEAMFAAAYRLAPDTPKAMQLLSVSFDLGILLLLIPMLTHLRMDPRRVLIYAWNPLVPLQFVHSAHYDGAMILPLLASLYLLAGGRRVLSGAALGVSVMVKLVPLVAVPPLAPALGVGGITALAVVAGAGLLPWLAASGNAGGILSEATDARFNDSAGLVLSRLLGAVSPDPDGVARSVAAGLLILASILLLARAWRNAGGQKEPLVSTYRMLGAFILLNAVVEPWYLTWMVPFLCFVLMPRPGAALGWLLLSGSVVLTDLTYLPGGTSAWPWVRAAEYLPLYGLLALEAGRRGARLLPRLRERRF